MSIANCGWFGFVEMLVYIVILLAGYVYLWKKGALDWNRPAGAAGPHLVTDQRRPSKTPSCRSCAAWDRTR